MSRDTPPPRGERPAWVVAAAAAIVVMITWTVVVKYLVPIAWYWSERWAGRVPESIPILWDFWPLAHGVLLWALWRRPRWAWSYALAVSLVECAVVVTKFALFLRAPETTLWRLLWFTNKLYVLALFLALTAMLLSKRARRYLHGTTGS